MTTAQNHLEKVLKATLEGAAVRAERVDPDGSVPLDIEMAGERHRLRAIWAGEGWPADVHLALDAVSDPAQWPRDLVVIARHLSPGSIALLRRQGANWADEAGQARIAGPGLLVVREPTEQHEREPTLSWSPSALAIGEALLSREWPEGIGTTELASVSGFSPPQVSGVLRKFDANGWTVKSGPQRGPGARREIADANGLLAEWATAVAGQDPERRLVHRTLRTPMRFLHDELAPALDKHTRWALTGWGAADELAPLMSRVPTLQIYIQDDDFTGPLDAVIRELDLAEIGEGSAIEFRAAPSVVLALNHIHRGLRLASPPRIYADLLAVGGRGEDAATHLKEEVIDPAFVPTDENRKQVLGKTREGSR